MGKWLERLKNNMFLLVAKWEDDSTWEVDFLSGLSNNDANLLRLMVLSGGMILRICWGQYFLWELQYFFGGTAIDLIEIWRHQSTKMIYVFFSLTLSGMMQEQAWEIFVRFRVWYVGSIIYSCTQRFFQWLLTTFLGSIGTCIICRQQNAQGLSTRFTQQLQVVFWVEFRYLIDPKTKNKPTNTISQHRPRKKGCLMFKAYHSWPLNFNIDIQNYHIWRQRYFTLSKPIPFGGISSLKFRGSKFQQHIFDFWFKFSSYPISLI